MVEIQENNTIQIPRTLEEFIEWEQPNDGFKYEYNDGELIKFQGMNKKQLFIFSFVFICLFKFGFYFCEYVVDVFHLNILVLTLYLCIVCMCVVMCSFWQAHRSSSSSRLQYFERQSHELALRL